MRIKCLIVTDKTLTNIVNKKHDHISHQNTKRWRDILNERHVFLVSWRSGERHLFQIERYEMIKNVIKIYLKHENAKTRTAVHYKQCGVQSS